MVKKDKDWIKQDKVEVKEVKKREGTPEYDMSGEDFEAQLRKEGKE